jgi:hypothetical protein
MDSSHSHSFTELSYLSEFVYAGCLWRTYSETARLRPAMFTDLFHLLESLEHDYREERGQKVHAYDCRRSALELRLNGVRGQILKLLRDIEFAIGKPIEKE